MAPAQPPRNIAVRPLEWTAGVDWFRWRMPRGEEAWKARRIAEELQQLDAEAGEKISKFKFDTGKGIASPRVRWATSLDTLWWETSGEWADSTWTRMPLSVGRCTRLDLQSTWKLCKPVPEFGMRFLPHEEMTPDRRLPNGTAVGWSHLPDGGWLGTVGPRTRPEYWRLYDKGVETGKSKPGWLWRLELELKYAHAAQMGSKCRLDLLSPKWCAQYVMSRWLQSGLRLPLNVDAPSLDAIRPGRKPEPSAEELLAWIERSVKPCVERMILAGKIQQLLFALGLTDVVEPIPPDHGRRGIFPS